MGYLLFESSETGFQTGLAQLHDAIRETGLRDDGSTEIEMTVRGRKEKKLVFHVKNPNELLDILKCNVD